MEVCALCGCCEFEPTVKDTNKCVCGHEVQYHKAVTPRDTDIKDAIRSLENIVHNLKAIFRMEAET